MLTPLFVTVSQLEATEKRLARASDDLKAAQDALVCASDDAQWYKRRAGELEAALKGRETELEMLLGRAGAGELLQTAAEDLHKAVLQGKDAEIDGLKERTREAEEGIVGVVEAMGKLRAYAHDRVAVLEGEVRAARDRLAELEGEVRAGRELYEAQLCGAETALKGLEGRVGELEGEKQVLEGVCNKMRVELGNLDEERVWSEKRVSELEVALKAATYVQRSNAEEMRAHLEENRAARAAAEGESESLSRLVAGLKEELLGLGKARERADEALSLLEAAKASNRLLETKLELAESEEKRLAAEVSSASFGLKPQALDVSCGASFFLGTQASTRTPPDSCEFPRHDSDGPMHGRALPRLNTLSRVGLGVAGAREGHANAAGSCRSSRGAPHEEG